MTKTTGRAYHNGDEHGIVALYNLITGASRTVEQHLWEWLDVPSPAKSKIWVIEDETGEIVGHHGLIALPGICNDKPILLGKTENTILHPRYLGTGIYFLHERRFAKEAEDFFDVMITTAAGGVPGKIRNKLGFIIIDEYERLLKIIKFDYLDSKIKTRNYYPLLRVLTGIGYGCYRLFIRSRKGKPAVQLSAITDIGPWEQKIDSFWNENRKYYGLTIDRTAKFLKWRFLDNPNLRYDFLIAASRTDNIIGYCIVLPRDNGKLIKIQDIIVEKNNPDLVEAFLLAIEEYYKDANAVSFHTLRSNRTNGIFRKTGYIPVNAIGKLVSKKPVDMFANKFMAKSKKLHPMDYQKGENWYYTEIFSEGVE